MEDESFIEEVFDRSKDELVPILLRFQNGNLTADDEDRVEYCTMMNRETRCKETLVVADGQLYSGPINTTEQLSDTYICVRDRETNKVTIMPLDEANLKHIIYSEQRSTKDPNEKLDSLNEEAKKKKLAKEFSGRKAAMLYDTSQKMKVEVGIIKDDLDATVQETEINEDELKNVTESPLDDICPKCNKEATSINDIYDIHDLIPKNLFERLDSEAKAVYEADVKSLPIKSKYLMSSIEELKSGGKKVDLSDALYKIKIIVFMDSLFNFLKSKDRKLKSMELSGITEQVETYLRRSFFDQPIKNSTLCDKALCYYIVLCLLISEDNSVNTSMLAEELGKSKTNILTYAHLVNALPKGSKSELVTLRLPQKVPPLKTSFRKRRR